jgi:hypothetical protein
MRALNKSKNVAKRVRVEVFSRVNGGLSKKFGSGVRSYAPSAAKVSASSKTARELQPGTRRRVADDRKQ